ncbi:MAG TPA: hypothetical protein VL691_19125 [Vicinamibacteria bacterium]|nr:hypothetical protein [Vicinamibacteria bacterium]
MKVHVTLRKSVAGDPAARQAALERVLAAGRMRLGNPRRFEKYGIITGEPNLGLLERLRSLPEVDAVEVDEEDGIAGRGRTGAQRI